LLGGARKFGQADARAQCTQASDPEHLAPIPSVAQTNSRPKYTDHQRLAACWLEL
jgi:hypothetical protein